MTTVDTAVAHAESAATGVTDASARLAGCGESLDEVAAVLDELGVSARAADVRAARSTVDELLSRLGALREELENLRAAILALRGTGAGPLTGPALSGGTEIKDPAFDKGSLGPLFRPGVFRREDFEHEHERDTADHLADRSGCGIYARRAGSAEGVPNPDAMVRWDRSDPGQVTEFKRLLEASYYAVRRNIWRAGKQVTPWGGGDVIIDGREVGLTATQARDHVTEAVAEARRKSKPLPAKIHVILNDGSVVTMPGREDV